MKAKEIEEKVEIYLQKREEVFVKDSVRYGGIMKDVKSKDDEKEDKHVVLFLMSTEVEDMPCFIHANIKTEELERLITPHFFESINE